MKLILFFCISLNVFGSERYLTILSNYQDDEVIRVVRTSVPLGFKPIEGMESFLSNEQVGLKARLKSFSEVSLTWEIVPKIIPPFKKSERILMTPFEELLFRDQNFFSADKIEKLKAKKITLSKKIKNSRPHGISFRAGFSLPLVSTYDFIATDDVTNDSQLIFDFSYLLPITANLFFAPSLGLRNRSSTALSEEIQSSSIEVGGRFIFTFLESQVFENSLLYTSIGLGVGLSETKYQEKSYEGSTFYFPKLSFGIMRPFASNNFLISWELNVESENSKEKFEDEDIQQSLTKLGSSIALTKLF
jgi:hypothetical protein